VPVFKTKKECQGQLHCELAWPWDESRIVKDKHQDHNRSIY